MRKATFRMAVVLASVSLIGAVAQGAALTAARNTPQIAGKQIEIGVFTNTIIYAGAMVAVTNASPYARPAADSAGYQVIGRAAQTVDNRTNADGAGTSGAKRVKVDIGIFRWNGPVFTQGDIGRFAYVHDDNTVTNTGATADIIAGTIFDVDASGVWVVTRDYDRVAASYTTIGVSGAATFDGTVTANDAVTMTAAMTNSGSEVHSGSETHSGLVTVSGGLAVTGSQTNTSDLTIDSKYAAVGGDATTGLMIQYGSIVSTNGTGVVNFAASYPHAQTPSVGLGVYGNLTNAFMTAIGSNYFYFKYVTATNDGTLYWNSVGPRP